MIIDTYPHEPRALIAFKRFMVRSEHHQELDSMVQAVYSLPLEQGADYVIAGATLYFGTDEDRTLFLLAYNV